MNNMEEKKKRGIPIKRIAIFLLLVCLAVIFLFGLLDRKKTAETMKKKEYAFFQMKIAQMIKQEISQEIQNITQTAKPFICMASGIYLFDREYRQEIITDGYEIRKRMEDKDQTRRCYPEIQMVDKEKEKAINKILTEELAALEECKPFGMEFDYTITVAEEQYISILYDLSYGENGEQKNHEKSAITIDLEKEKAVSILDLKLETYDIYFAFIKESLSFCENAQKERLLEKISFDELEESMWNWEKTMDETKWGYYLTDKRVGVILEGNLCIEVPFDWKENLKKFSEFILYKEYTKTELMTETYKIMMVEEDLAATHKNYLDFSRIQYPQIHMKDKEIEKRINQSFYEAATYYYNPEALKEYGTAAYKTDYNIVYADEDRISILYYAFSAPKSSYYIGVTVDLKTGETIPLEEFGTMEELYQLFLETKEYYSFSIIRYHLQLLFTENEKEDIFKFLNEKEDYSYGYYLIEDRIGLIIASKVDLCVEIKIPSSSE